MELIHVQDLVTRIGGNLIHNGVSFSVQAGEVMGIVGGSGSGKSVLLNTMIGLRTPTKGHVSVLGVDSKSKFFQKRSMRARWGVLFQSGALFGSLTVLENIMIPLIEIGKLNREFAKEVAHFKIKIVGLPYDAAYKYPQELSGGMVKRAALARALALDPELVFLDEPTSGLDPLSGAYFDELILELQQSLGLTVVMITHDLDSLRRICNRISVLVDQKMITGDLETLMNHPHPWIHSYFNTHRDPLRPKEKN